MREICILNGEGTSRFSANNLKFALTSALQNHGFTARFIRAVDIAHPDNNPLNNPRNILVFGGGSFGAVKSILGQRGLARIQRFVESGGTYIGICMGSYAAARFIEFQGDGYTKATEGLGFFNDIVRGSLPITPSLFEGTSRSATIAEMTHAPSGISFPALYWGGNAFELEKNTDAPITPLAQMRTPCGDVKIMGLRVAVGTQGGQALLSGYHPEAFSHQSIWQWVSRFSGGKDDMRRIDIELKQHPNHAYKMGLACLLDDAALVPGHSFARQIWDEAPLPARTSAGGIGTLSGSVAASPSR